MEELKLLVDMVAHLPQMALWVIAAFWVYKVTVIGSIYGLIKLFIVKLHAYMMAPGKTFRKTVEIDTRLILDGLCISGTKEDLIYQLKRVAGKRTGISSEYIHKQSIEWLRDAIDAQIEKEQQSK